jgi:hypothetical protein
MKQQRKIKKVIIFVDKVVKFSERVSVLVLIYLFIYFLRRL